MARVGKYYVLVTCDPDHTRKRCLREHNVYVLVALSPKWQHVTELPGIELKPDDKKCMIESIRRNNAAKIIQRYIREFFFTLSPRENWTNKFL